MTRQSSLLFDDPADEGLKQDYLGIQGLMYLPGVLTPEEQVKVLAEIDKIPWQDDLKRRVQHYGYKYDYKARAVNHSMYVGRLPPFAIEVVQQLMSHGLISGFPDQLIVNEYQAGQGISAHVDCEPCFKDTIVTVSLGSTYEMDFISLESREVCSTLLLDCAIRLRVTRRASSFRGRKNGPRSNNVD